MKAVDYRQGILAAADGLKLYEQVWQMPEAKGWVILVHGITEYSDRHRPTIQVLLQQNFAVQTFDLRGHGKSEGDRVYINHFAEYLSDLDLVVRRALAQTGGRPLFLLGHSLGGAIATRYVIEFPEMQSQLSGLILSAPALAINDAVPLLLLQAADVISRFFPKLPTLSLEGAAISRDPEVVAAYHADPLVYHGRLLARPGAELVKTIREIQPQMSVIQLPLLLMHGTGDRTVPWVASQMLYDRSRSPDKTLKLYQGLYHEIFNEPERAQVWQDLSDWLLSQVSITLKNEK
ncbi:MAG: alpha/beta hydrolase [Synechococcales cyanobacterium RU_4_20]|nr:alpha/beta hydrolase [Synechococcales cyanobacterium RU_4_20]NJR67295.1 alpha/beta hydrolase [Synechococcales cyanobacterium CRU_2_2]